MTMDTVLEADLSGKTLTIW